MSRNYIRILISAPFDDVASKLRELFPPPWTAKNAQESWSELALKFDLSPSLAVESAKGNWLSLENQDETIHVHTESVRDESSDDHRILDSDWTEVITFDNRDNGCLATEVFDLLSKDAVGKHWCINIRNLTTTSVLHHRIPETSPNRTYFLLLCSKKNSFDYWLNTLGRSLEDKEFGLLLRELPDCLPEVFQFNGPKREWTPRRNLWREPQIDRGGEWWTISPEEAGMIEAAQALEIRDF